MKRAGMGERHSSPINDEDIHGSIAKVAETKAADALKQASTSSGSSAVTLYSRPTPGVGEQVFACGTPQGPHDRREAWLDRGQLPSFEFKPIDDEHVLKVVAAQHNATRDVATAARVQAEETRRLTGIAVDIQKKMEGEVAFILKELASIPASTDAVLAAAPEAKTAFSLFIKHFQNAKLAAGNGMQAQMVAELGLALDKLASFSKNHTGPTACKPLALKGSGSKIRSTLERLVLACKTWTGNASPPETPVTASNADATCSTVHAESEARSRSVSSPEPITRKAAAREQARLEYSGLSPTGKKAFDRKANDPERPSSPTAAAGRKLKALFSRSSEPTIRKDDDSDANSSPRSPRNRSASTATASQSSTTTSMPDPIGQSRESAMSSPLKSPHRTKKNRESDD